MIGVVGSEPESRAVADRIESRCDVPVRADRVAADDVELLVGVGEDGAIDLVRRDPSIPAVFVDAGPDLPSIPTDGVPAAVNAVLAGSSSYRRLSLATTRIDGVPIAPALFDVSLVASDPGRISEFGIDLGASDHHVRADGVVVATPMGSRGYAHAAGGPIVAAMAALVVRPIAAFTMDHHCWVVDTEAVVSLTVERDEGPVSLVVDGREERSVSPGVTIAIEVGPSLRVVAND